MYTYTYKRDGSKDGWIDRGGKYRGRNGTRAASIPRLYFGEWWSIGSKGSVEAARQSWGRDASIGRINGGGGGRERQARKPPIDLSPVLSLSPLPPSEPPPPAAGGSIAGVEAVPMPVSVDESVNPRRLHAGRDLPFDSGSPRGGSRCVHARTRARTPSRSSSFFFLLLSPPLPPPLSSPLLCSKLVETRLATEKKKNERKSERE